MEKTLDKALPFEKASILQKVKSYVNSVSEKEKKRNPAFVEQLLALNEDNLTLKYKNYGYKTGIFHVDCQVQGAYDAYGETHKTNVLAMEAKSDVVVYPTTCAQSCYVHDAERYIPLAGKLLKAVAMTVIGYCGSSNGGYENYGMDIGASQTTLDTWEKRAVQFVAQASCDITLSREKVKLSYCQVTDYSFDTVLDTRNLDIWEIFATLKDEKGNDVELSLGHIFPKTFDCDDFEINLAFQLPLNASNDKKQKVKEIAPLVLSIVAVIFAIIFGGRYEFLYGTAGVSMILYFLPKFVGKGQTFKVITRIASILLAVFTIVVCLLPLLGGGGQAEGTPTALLSLLW